MRDIRSHAAAENRARSSGTYSLGGERDDRPRGEFGDPTSRAPKGPRRCKAPRRLKKCNQRAVHHDSMTLLADVTTSREVLVFDHDRMQVLCHRRKRIIHHQMRGPVVGRVFREALTAGVRAMKTYHCSKWLSDDRANGALLPGDLKWAQEVWLPEAVGAGWKHWALVMPMTWIGQVNVQRHMKMYADRGIRTGVFADPLSAMAWLQLR